MADHTTPAGYATGRRPPKQAPAIRFAAIRDLVTPTYPPTYDSLTGVGGWLMLGNDSAGDCVAVTWASERRTATLGAGEEHYPSLAQVTEFYKTQNPAFAWDDPRHGPGSDDDQGMEIQTALEELHRNGGPDGVRAVAFAKVDHTDVDEVKAALAAFRTLWLGVVVTSTNEADFPARSWTLTGQPLGGHSIMGHRYNDTLIGMQTWGDKGTLALPYVLRGNRYAGVEEAWVVLWPEQAKLLDAAGRAALDGAYAAVTGGKRIDWTGIPLPGPTPPPVSDDWQVLRDWLASGPRFYRKVQDVIRRLLAEHDK